MIARGSSMAAMFAALVIVSAPGSAAPRPQESSGQTAAGQGASLRQGLALLQPPAAPTTPALLARGLEAYRKGDHARARTIFRELARRDVAVAETLLGTMTATGQGGPKDPAVAAAWFMRAARRGYAPAQLALADAFARGHGVPLDRDRAITLARAAAVQGQPGAAQLVARHLPPQYALLGPIRP